MGGGWGVCATDRVHLLSFEKQPQALCISTVKKLRVILQRMLLQTCKVLHPWALFRATTVIL